MIFLDKQIDNTVTVVIPKYTSLFGHQVIVSHLLISDILTTS